MPKVAPHDKANSKSDSKPRPYAPSWVDRFTAWVARLPGPSWVYYLGLGLVLLFVQAIAMWVEGAFPIGTFLPIQGFHAGVIAFFLALFHYLDDRADAALTTLRPALKASEKEYSELRYQVTTLPARPTLLTSLAILISFMVMEHVIWSLPSSFDALATSPISWALLYLIYRLLWWIFGTLIYHTIHQLRVINRIFARHTRVSLFRMRPLYAFSSLTALTAVSLTVIPYAWMAINPGALSDPIAIRVALPFTILAVVTFVWPLLGVHRLLVEEKERLLGEGSLRLEASIVELQGRMDSGKLEGMDDLYKAIAGLQIQQNALDKIPTWPWEPETVRLLITALALPLGLWIAQFVLQRLLGV
jgi:hypothetical protein